MPKQSKPSRGDHIPLTVSASSASSDHLVPADESWNASTAIFADPQDSANRDKQPYRKTRGIGCLTVAGALMVLFLLGGVLSGLSSKNSSTSKSSTVAVTPSGYPGNGRKFDVTELNGPWTGYYLCNNETRGLRLTIQLGGTTGEAPITGVFEFSPTKDSPSLSPGSFTMSGKINTDGSLTLNPERWVNHPAGYEPVGLQSTGYSLASSGVLNISGTVRQFTGCTNFVVGKSPS